MHLHTLWSWCHAPWIVLQCTAHISEDVNQFVFEEYENPFLKTRCNWWCSKGLLLNNDLRNVKNPSQSQWTIINYLCSDLVQLISFYCEWKTVVLAPNADAVIFDGCCSCASIRYYQLLASSWNKRKKNFEIMQTLFFGSLLLCWFNHKIPKELTVFGMCIWSIAWNMIIKASFRFLSHQEINIPVTNHQTVSIQSHQHHRVIMWPSLLKFAKTRLEHCHFLSK